MKKLFYTIVVFLFFTSVSFSQLAKYSKSSFFKEQSTENLSSKESGHFGFGLGGALVISKPSVGLGFDGSVFYEIPISGFYIVPQFKFTTTGDYTNIETSGSMRFPISNAYSQYLGSDGKYSYYAEYPGYFNVGTGFNIGGEKRNSNIGLGVFIGGGVNLFQNSEITIFQTGDLKLIFSKETTFILSSEFGVKF
ncbi:MAG: hypothetical protein WC358_09950 [Ignavibacteria bacterium]|jgi:hypothetical protein